MGVDDVHSVDGLAGVGVVGSSYASPSSIVNDGEQVDGGQLHVVVLGDVLS